MMIKGQQALPEERDLVLGKETYEGESSQWVRLQQKGVIIRGPKPGDNPITSNEGSRKLPSEEPSLTIAMRKNQQWSQGRTSKDHRRRQRPDDEERCANPEECNQWGNSELGLRGAATRGMGERRERRS